MQTDLLRLLEKYHFLRLEDIEDKIQDYINTEKLDTAIRYLNEVSEVYVSNRQAIIGSNSFLVAHFEWMHEIDRELEMKGEKYPDGSKYRFDHEIRNLIQKVEGERKINSPKKHDREEINDLFDILYKPEVCMEYLMRIEPPVITDSYEFRLDSKKKSAIVAWFDVLDERGYVKHHISSQERSRLINQKIHSINLGADGKIFRDEPTNVYQRYLKKFKNIIPKNTPS